MTTKDLAFCIWICQYFNPDEEEKEDGKKEPWICYHPVGPYVEFEVVEWDVLQAYFDTEVIPNMPSRKIDLNDYNIRNPEIKP